MVKRPVPFTIKVIKFFLRPILMVTTKRDWQGMDNLPEGGFVLAPNHVSHADPFLIGHFMLDNNIAPRFLAKDTLVGAKGYGWILRTAEQIPVYRSTEGAAESLRAAMAAVEAGKVVTIYPEGTITRDPAAWPMSGRTGAVRVAPPVDLSDFAGQELTEEVLHAATDRLMDTLTAMLAEVRGELPSTPRIDVHTLSKPRSNYKQ